MGKRLSDSERAARAAERRYNKALALSTAVGPAGGVELETLKTEATQLRKRADSDKALSTQLTTLAKGDAPTTVPKPKVVEGKVVRERSVRPKARPVRDRLRQRARTDIAGAQRGGADLLYSAIVGLLGLAALELAVTHSTQLASLMNFGSRRLASFAYPTQVFPTAPTPAAAKAAPPRPTQHV